MIHFRGPERFMSVLNTTSSASNSTMTASSSSAHSASIVNRPGAAAAAVTSLALPPQMAMSDMSSPPIFKVPGLPMMKARKQARMAATPNKENSGDTSTDDEIPAAKSRQRKIVDPFPKDDNPGLSNSSSRKRKSSLAADMDYMGGLLDDARHITNWIPALKGRKMLVEGDLLDFK